mmetsp:Transcript_123693/g.283591  ORF Transcript_123693/g.283591 Transcript_123693/m.283591 type:complete len:270 (+) Transcript_123693:2-811(+)
MGPLGPPYSLLGWTQFFREFIEYARNRVLVESPVTYAATPFLVGLAVLASWSHLCCMLSDPGAIQPGEYIEMATDVPHVTKEVELDSATRRREHGRFWCKKCSHARPPRAHHCSTCRRCIRKMDHHCPWVNNCIGQYNQKHFVLFCFYTLCLCLVALGILLRRGLTCGGDFSRFSKHASLACDMGSAEVLCYIVVFFSALVFALFTILMMFDQISGIVNDSTGIEMLQNSQSDEVRDWRQSLEEVFGGPPSWRWLLPLPYKRLNPKCMV